MAGRGMLFDEGPTACPFVALETDRDRRAGEPDPRHRCYAEPTPAPRALAHQREFCLSPGFGGCPIFQDWAIRAAARPVPLRPAIDRGPATDERTALEQLSAFGSRPAGQGEAGHERYMRPAEPPPASAATDRVPSMPTDAASEPEPEPEPEPEQDAPGLEAPGTEASVTVAPPATTRSADADNAAATTDQPADEAPPRRRRHEEDWPPAASPGAPTGTQAAAPLPPFLAHRQGERPAEPARRVDYAQRHEPGQGHEPASRQHARPNQRVDVVPAWERERYAAYPKLGRRLGGGDAGTLLGRLTKIFGVLALLALLGAALILMPSLLGGIAVPATPSPSPTAPTASPSPTAPPTPSPVPEPTTITHRIAPGETLFGISVEYGVTVEQILAANPTITNPNLIQVGQVIVIPPDDFEVPTPAPAPPSP